MLRSAWLVLNRMIVLSTTGAPRQCRPLRNLATRIEPLEDRTAPNDPFGLFFAAGGLALGLDSSAPPRKSVTPISPTRIARQRPRQFLDGALRVTTLTLLS